MPIVEATYKVPFLFKNGFVATVYSGLFRRVNGVMQERERITLSDGDFLDLDWSYSKEKATKLCILLHGLEGDSKRPYMLGAAKMFNANGIDAVGVNFRGCSGTPNLRFRSYHSGATEDLEDVVQHIIATRPYADIYIKGFSLGGNMALKYLGENPNVPPRIKGAVAVSVPCSLLGSCIELHKFNNIAYHERFRMHLLGKLKQKQKQFPEKVSDSDLKAVKTLKDFDDIYTSKAHGFKDAMDYYHQCSSLQFLKDIKIPTLIINALNDSFLSSDCYPVKAAKHNPNLYLEMPKFGGHVAFVKFNGCYYNEKRALEFIQTVG